MSDSFKNENEDWDLEEDSGYYGEPDDWFNIPEDKPKSSEPEDVPPESEDPGPIVTYHENEPEEELAQWTGVIQEDSVPDPFFDPDVPNIEREDSGPEEETKNTAEPETKSPRLSSFSFNKKRILFFVIIGVAFAAAVGFIIYSVMNTGKQPTETPVAEEPEEVIVTENTSISTVRHISFPRLSVENEEGCLSVKDFSQILDSLYENGYVLVDVYAIAARDEAGNFTLSEEVEVPEGKKPLILSQRDVPNPENYDAGTFADGLTLDEDGYLRSVYADEDGNVGMGDLDVVPILESFIREHKDFSFAGARGVAALTGYGGLIGELDSANVIAVMKEGGWRFASNGYKGISYGSEYSLIEQDALSWNENVKAKTGDTDLIILPRKTDISSWAPYSLENPKYKLLNNLGFRYYFLHAPETPGFLQVEDGYVKEAILEIDTYQDYKDALKNGEI